MSLDFNRQPSLCRKQQLIGRKCVAGVGGELPDWFQKLERQQELKEPLVPTEFYRTPTPTGQPVEAAELQQQKTLAGLTAVT